MTDKKRNNISEDVYINRMNEFPYNYFVFPYTI